MIDIEAAFNDLISRYASTHGGCAPSMIMASDNLIKITNIVKIAKFYSTPLILIKNNSSIIGAFDFTITYIN